MKIVEVRDFASEDLKAMFEEAQQIFEECASDAVNFICTYPLYQGIEIEISRSDLEDYTKISSPKTPDSEAPVPEALDEYLTLFLTEKICFQYDKALVWYNVLEAYDKAV